MADGFEGINALQKYLEDCIASADPANVLAAQAAAAEQFCDEMHALSAPRKTGKMLSSIAYQQDTGKTETVIGWGEFYGRLKENGHRTRAAKKTRKKTKSTRMVKAQPHFLPTFTANREQITATMCRVIERS